MIRGIKFRGKRLDNGEWVYGYYAVIHHSLTEIDHKTNTIVRVGVEEIPHIYNDEINDNCCNWKEVEPDTVGQFTGLLDKDGKEIYEGDILQVDGEAVMYVVEWHDAGLKARQISNRSTIGLSNWKKYSTVIGNIHDNFELLKI